MKNNGEKVHITDRERTVLALLDAGLTRRQVAKQLDLSIQRIGQLVDQLVAKGALERGAEKGAKDGTAIG